MFTVHHAYGEMESSPPLSRVEDLLTELRTVADDEHPDVGVTHESGWSLGVGRSLQLTWEDVEGDGGVFHHPPVSWDEALRSMRAVAQGDLEAVNSFEWQPGNGD